MLDSTLVVQSAISTFNNAALWAPDFFWTAVLCLPLFIVSWIMAPQMCERFLPDVKARGNFVSALAIAAIFVWALTHENFGVLRDASYVGILVAVILYACSKFLSQKYYESKFRLSNHMNVKEKWKPRIDAAVPALVVATAGLCATSAGWQVAALQAGAVAAGVFAGYLLNWKKAREDDSNLRVGALIFLGTFGLILQPEFFRFGQLGNLTVIHLLFLVMGVAAVSVYLVLRFVRPRGWLTAPVYRKLKLIMRMATALVLVLFAMTESAFVFIMFAIAVMAVSFVFARHQPAKDADGLKLLKNDLWLVSLGLFGVLAAMPVLTCAAIAVWRLDMHSDFRNKIKALL